MCDFYQPIPDLQAPGLEAPRTKTLTIIFVTALHILYNKRSNDPIFPANEPFRYPGDTKDYYYNSSPKARAFACIDETLLCGPSGSPCWTATDPIPSGVANTSAYWLMKYALKNSNTYDSIKYRLGTALLAQQRVGQSRSLPLPDDHWEAEAEHLFKSSLARAQFDAWSIASGEDHDVATYKDTLPDEARGKVCGLFKFNSVGYVNIQIWPFALLLLVLPASALLSRETKQVRHILWKVYISLKEGAETLLGKRDGHTAVAGNQMEDDGSDSALNEGSSAHGHQETDAQSVAESSTAAAQRSDATLARTPLSATRRTSNQPSDYGSFTNNGTNNGASRPPSCLSNTGPQRSRGSSSGQSGEDMNDEWFPLLIHSIILYWVPMAVKHTVCSPKYLVNYLRGRDSRARVRIVSLPS